MHRQFISKALEASRKELLPLGLLPPRSSISPPPADVYERIYSRVNEIFYKGAPNRFEASEIYMLMCFYVGLINRFISHRQSRDYLRKCEGLNDSLSRLVLNTLFGKIYHCGKCSEQAAAVVMERLCQPEEFKSVEIISISGRMKLSPEEKKSGIVLSDRHRIAIFERPVSSHLHEPETWAGAYGVDPWSKQIFRFGFTRDSLADAGRLEGELKITSEYRRDTPLSEKECQEIQAYLRQLKDFLSAAIIKEQIKEIMDESLSQADLKDSAVCAFTTEEPLKILEKIHLFIDQEILLYQNLLNKKPTAEDVLEYKLSTELSESPYISLALFSKIIQSNPSSSEVNAPTPSLLQNATTKRIQAESSGSLFIGQNAL